MTLSQDDLERWKTRVMMAVGEQVPNVSLRQFSVSVELARTPDPAGASDNYEVVTKWLTLWDWFIVIRERERFVEHFLKGVPSFTDCAAFAAKELVERRAKKAEQLMPGVPANEVDRIRNRDCPV